MEELESFRQSLCRVLGLRGENISETSIRRAIGERSISLLHQHRPRRGDGRAMDALQEEKEEEVRERLREASTAEELALWIGRAREMDMEFEVSLGERKLKKLPFDPPSVSDQQQPEEPLLSAQTSD